MKQFNLEEYLKNPNRKVITRDGRNVRVICTDRLDEVYPVVALWQWKDHERRLCEEVESYTIDGEFDMGSEYACDLFFAPEKKEGWINILRGLLKGTAKIKIEWKE